MNSSPARRLAFASGWVTSSRSSPKMTTIGGRAGWSKQKMARLASSLHQSCRSGEREKHTHRVIVAKRRSHRESIPPHVPSFSSALSLTLFVSLGKASGMYSHGEDKTGAAGQLYLVWQKEEAVQRQVFGKAQCRYTIYSHTQRSFHACAHRTTCCRHCIAGPSKMLFYMFTFKLSECMGL